MAEPRDYYRAVLVAISELVQEDNAYWKKASILDEIALKEGHDGDLYEFLSWFDEDEGDD